MEAVAEKLIVLAKPVQAVQDEETTVPNSSERKAVADSVEEPLKGAARYSQLGKKDRPNKQEQRRQLEKYLQPNWAKSGAATGNQFAILSGHTPAKAAAKKK